MAEGSCGSVTPLLDANSFNYFWSAADKSLDCAIATKPKTPTNPAISAFSLHWAVDCLVELKC
jgi:hypothetical protein